MTKYVFVTGGVVSSLGKGIAAASLAAILASRGVRVTNLKLDPRSAWGTPPIDSSITRRLYGQS